MAKRKGKEQPTQVPVDRLTVHEWYELSKNPLIGAPDLLAPHRERICALVVDGRAFGDHFVDEPRYFETDLLANVLVSCEVDTQIASVKSLSERPGKNTPDFEAVLVDGNLVRIEVTQSADAPLRTYVGALRHIFRPVQLTWRADAAICSRIRGMHIIFSFPGNAPHGQDRHRVGEEILSILRRIDRRWVTLCYRLRPPTDCVVLTELGVTWVIRSMSEAEPQVQFRPSLTLPNADRVVDAAVAILANKKAKFRDYSDSGAFKVWLAVFASDGISAVGLSAIQKMRNKSAALNPAPFSRLMIANHAAGLLLESDMSKPAIYRSLSEYREISRA